MPSLFIGASHSISDLPMPVYLSGWIYLNTVTFVERNVDVLIIYSRVYFSMNLCQISMLIAIL